MTRPLLPLALLATLLPGSAALAASPSPTPSSSLIDTLPRPVPSVKEPRPSVVLSGPFLFYEDFEKGHKRWELEKGPKGVGWNLLKASTCGGLYTMLIGKLEKEKQVPYQNASGTLFLCLKEPIDLRSAKRPHLKFDLKGLCDPPESIEVQAELRRVGKKSWTPVGWASHARYILVSTRFADLTPWIHSRIEMRFRATLKGTAKDNKGLYFDDVQIVEPDLRFAPKAPATPFHR